jgi:hypothetical protein
MGSKKWARSALAIVAMMALFVAACRGGGDDNTGAIKVTGDTGSDQQFAADVCKAYRSFTTELTRVLQDTGNIKSPDDLTKRYAGPFDTLARAFAKAKPPKDLKEWHEAAAKQLADVAGRLQKGNLDAAAGLGANPIPSLPASVGATARLNGVVGTTKECKDVGFTFEEK